MQKSQLYKRAKLLLSFNPEDKVKITTTYVLVKEKAFRSSTRQIMKGFEF